MVELGVEDCVAGVGDVVGLEVEEEEDEEDEEEAAGADDVVAGAFD